MLKMFITQGKKLLIYLTIMQKLNQKPFKNANNMKLKEQTENINA